MVIVGWIPSSLHFFVTAVCLFVLQLFHCEEQLKNELFETHHFNITIPHLCTAQCLISNMPMRVQ